jgi:hypothetical protein
MYSIRPIHWDIKSAPAIPGRSRVGPALYVFSLLGVQQERKLSRPLFLLYCNDRPPVLHYCTLYMYVLYCMCTGLYLICLGGGGWCPLSLPFPPPPPLPLPSPPTLAPNNFRQSADMHPTPHLQILHTPSTHPHHTHAHARRLQQAISTTAHLMPASGQQRLSHTATSHAEQHLKPGPIKEQCFILIYKWTPCPPRCLDD